MKTQKGIKAQEEVHRLASFPELNPNPIVEIDLFGKVKYLNPSAERLFPNLRSLGSKHPYFTGLNPLINRLRKGKNQELTIEVKVDDQWFHQTVHYLEDFKRIRIYAFNISKRKSMEDELNRNEQQIREVIHATQAGYYEHAIDNSTGMVSERFAEILGFRMKELPKYPKFASWLAQRVHKEDLEEFRKRVHDFHVGRIARFDHEYRILAKDGAWRWLHFITTVLQKNISGLPLYVAGLVFDITEQRRTEEALKESEKMLNKTQEIANLGTWAVDLAEKKRTNYWSDQTYRMYGYEPREVSPSGKAFNEVVHPDDRKMVEDAYFNSLKEGKGGYEYTFRIIKKITGELRTLREKCEYIKDSSGKIIRSIGMVQDITEQKKAEEKLSKFSHAVEQSPASIVITDLKGNIEYVNQGFVSGTGYSREEALGKNPRILKSGLTSSKTYKQLWDTICSGKEWIGELCNKKKNGELYWEQVSISPVKNADGELINFLAVKNDITKRKEAEEALEENEEKFRAVAETAKDAIISANDKGEIIYFNKGAEQVFGYPFTEALGKPITMLMPERFHHDHSHGFSRFLKTGRPHVIGKTVELTGIKKNGSELPIELSIANWNVRNKNYFTAIIRDITDRKNLEQRKDDFISIAGHELRTPISAVKIMNQILQDMLADNLGALKYLKKIDQQTSIQANLINDLLDVTKIQTGRLEIRKEQIDPFELIEEIAEDLRETTATHQIIVKGKTYGKIFADKDRIRQVLINFCTNAIKFSPKGEKIIIELKNKDKAAVVSVTDYGIGIPKEHHHGMFRRFYRVYGSGDKSFPGLGMGLYISYQIIQMHDGKMWFRSIPGKGSTFYFSIPFQK